VSDLVRRRADRAIGRARLTVSAAVLAVECARHTRRDAVLRRTFSRPRRPVATPAVREVHPVPIDDATDAKLRERLSRPSH
jgi:hypothetical protein